MRFYKRFALLALFDAIKRIHRGPIKFSRNLRPSPLRYFARASRSDKMSGVVEMLKRYFSPFVIVNRVEERIITRGEKRSSKEQFSLKKKKRRKYQRLLSFQRSIDFQNLINRISIFLAFLFAHSKNAYYNLSRLRDERDIPRGMIKCRIKPVLR